MRPNSNPKTEAKIVILMIVILAIPAALTLRTIENPRPMVDLEAHPSPLGYTWSLLLFIIPICALAWWFCRHRSTRLHKKTFWTTIFVLTPIGIFLDVIFGNLFFTFINTDAVLGIHFPGYKFGEGWVWDLPIEELVFYFTGFLFILLIYIWTDEYWLGAYDEDQYIKESQKLEKLVRFHPASLIFGVVLIVAAVLYKKYGDHPHREGFPGYFTFLVAASIVPACMLFHTTVRFINWRAFAMTTFFLVFTSLIWEATLAAPYQWWGYHYEQMIGITVFAWSNLPIEAVLVWILGTFTAVMIYEVIKMIYAMGRKTFVEALFGIKDSE